MGKVDDYTAGRSQGLILAREIVKKDGIEGLEKEIQFRNITGINTALTRKELNIACEKIKNVTHHRMIDPHTADCLYTGTYLHPVGVKTLCWETVQEIY